MKTTIMVFALFLCVVSAYLPQFDLMSKHTRSLENPSFLTKAEKARDLESLELRIMVVIFILTVMCGFE